VIADRPTMPLTPAQSGVWLLEQLGVGSSVVSIDRAWTVPESVRREALREAAGAVIRRHEALRTAIVATPEGPVQYVLADAPCVVRELPGTDSALTSFFAEPWNLSRPPGLRIATGPAPQPGGELVAVRVHHALCDGASLGVVLTDLAAAYRAALAGEAGCIPTERNAARFSDYVRDLRRRLDSAEGDRALAYWRKVLAEPAPPLAPPADQRPSVDRSHRARVTTFDVPAQQVTALERLARGSRVSVAAVLLAGVVTMLGATTGGRDVTIGVALASREDTPRDLVGMTTNLVPVRTDLRVHRTVGDLLRGLRQSLVGALEHGWMPHEAVLDRLRIPRIADQYPVFHVLVSLVDERGNPPFQLGRTPANEVVARTAGGARARTDVTIVLTRYTSRMVCRMEFDADLYGADRADRVTGWLRRVLTVLADQHDARPLAEVSPFAAGEDRPITAASSDVDSVGGAALAEAAVPPIAATSSGTAALVESVWQEVLGHSVVDNDRNFFEAGGTSLALVKVQAALRERGVDVRLVQLFRHPTIKTLTAYLARAEAGR
jgi:aryl carrier-like protein